MSIQPTPDLLAGRRALEGMRGVVLLEDLSWEADLRFWVLHCRLLTDTAPGGPVPPTTDWYVHLSPAYPWGEIDFYPAKTGGLVATFPHQRHNGPGASNRPWRDGNICVRTGLRAVGRRAYDVEPHDAARRLRWNFERALAWLADASRGRLVDAGDPFELPALPKSLTSGYMVFSEGVDTFTLWANIPERSGRADLIRTARNKECLLVRAFRSATGEVLFTPKWGLALEEVLDGETITGAWLRLEAPPTLPPYEIATTWQGLRVACRDQGVALDELIRVAVWSLRDGDRHPLLLGFPVPARAGESPQQMRWQPLRLPVLSRGGRVPAGFRANERGYWHRDRTFVLREGPIEWMDSKNWHRDEVSMRGRLPEQLGSIAALLIGVGALGSVLAELLVRGGVHQLLILDHDTLEAGNLARHTLGLDDVDRPKAKAVAERLNRASPHASVRYLCSRFPFVDDVGAAQVRDCDLVIDTTGSDEVLAHSERFEWGARKTFFSASIGLNAARLFCFTAVGTGFPHSKFRQLVNPWLEKDIQEAGGRELPREGIGCWHPVFPARVDDVWMMAGVVVKDLERSLATPPPGALLRVYGQEHEQGVFRGLRLLEEKHFSLH